MSINSKRVISIIPVETSSTDAIRMAVREVGQFLGLFYPAALIAQHEVAEKITGQWLSRIQAFHNGDDFLQLVRDYLQSILSGGERSKTSDSLAYYFSGFMPTYGASCTLIDMVYDGREWSEIKAFMHHIGYGDARKYIEDFDYKGAQTKIKSEHKAWLDILKQQDTALHLAQNGPPVQLAFAPSPSYLPTMTDVPLEPVTMPKTAAAPSRLASMARIALSPAMIGLLLLTIPGNAMQEDTEQQELDRMAQRETRRKKLAEEKKKLIILEVTQANTATSNTTNNRCTDQVDQNKKNGAECENDGYGIMEKSLLYKRLIDPPKGKGLDGLFEKPEQEKNKPSPFPALVTQPKAGKIIFIPAEATPPNIKYAWDKQFPFPAYPRFVVFEAKNIAKHFDEKDTEGITKEAKNRLKNTCDGQQMGTKWTEKRIPSALKKDKSKNKKEQKDRMDDIRESGYARWVFICLPGPLGNTAVTKTYIFIDIDASGVDLNSLKPKERKSSSTNDNAEF